MTPGRRIWLTVGVLAVLAAGGYFAWQSSHNGALPEGLASGNGRIEAVEIDVSAKSPGRIKEILVDEGDFVKAGDVLARMDTTQLEAQRRQAEAQLQRARIGVDTANTLIVQREAERTAAAAVVTQRRAEFDAAERTLKRSEQLAATNTISQQVLDNDRAAERSSAAAVAADLTIVASDLDQLVQGRYRRGSGVCRVAGIGSAADASVRAIKEVALQAHGREAQKPELVRPVWPVDGPVPACCG